MTPEELARVLATHRRVAIVGGPNTGKTTLAAHVTDRPIIATDDTMAHPWEDQPGILLKRVEGKESFCVEGVQVVRALRKGLKVDAIIILDTPHEPLTKEQRTMAKGHSTILKGALEMNPDVPIYRGGK